MLILLLVLTLRHSSISMSFLGVFAGMILDSLSHGYIGLYGISFFVTLLLARQLIKLFYANTFFALSLAVSVMTILEGWISLSILSMLETELNQSSLMLTSTLPLAVLHDW
jgi:rod shape-determining protein MreD